MSVTTTAGLRTLDSHLLVRPKKSPTDVPGSVVCSVEKALAVLESFQGPGFILGVTEVARRSNLPKSTAHRLLTVLASRGYVERQGNRYTAGARLFELGNRVAHTQPRGVRAHAVPFMIDLVRATDATATLAVRSGGDVIIVEKLYGHRGVRTETQIGDRVASPQCALGRAILAFMPEEVSAEAVLRWNVGDRGSSREALASELARIRAEGVAHERTLPAPQTISIAVPIIDPVVGYAIGAISATIRKNDAGKPHVEKDLRQMASAISRKLDFRAMALA